MAPATGIPAVPSTAAGVAGSPPRPAGGRPAAGGADEGSGWVLDLITGDSSRAEDGTRADLSQPSTKTALEALHPPPSCQPDTLTNIAKRALQQGHKVTPLNAMDILAYFNRRAKGSAHGYTQWTPDLLHIIVKHMLNGVQPDNFDGALQPLLQLLNDIINGRVAKLDCSKLLACRGVALTI